MANQLALTEIGYAFAFGALVFIDVVVVVIAIFGLLCNIRAQLEEKLRRYRSQTLASHGPVSRITYVQPCNRPGNADKEEPALLLQFFFILGSAAPFVGQQSLLDADYKGILEFEPFGGVQSHEPDAITARIVGVGIAKE